MMAIASMMGRSGPAGLLLAVTLAGWALLSSPGASGAAAYAAVLLACVLAWTAGAVTARWWPEDLALVIASGILVALLVTVPASLDGSPTAPPLGYANANAALCALAVAVLLSAASVRPRRRSWYVGAAAGFVVLAFLTHSRAGAATALLLLALWPLLPHRSMRLWRSAAATVMLAGTGAVAVLGLTGGAMSLTDPIESAVSDVRVKLWSDALTMARERPVAGVGAGEFAQHSALVAADPDLRFAHSLPLQVLAELGIVGLVLLAALAAWAVVVLGRGSMVLAVLALHPLVDSVWQLAPVTLLVALVLGAVSVTEDGLPSRGLRRGRATGVAAREAAP